MVRCILINLSFLVSCLLAGFLTFRQNFKRRCLYKQYPRIFNCLFGLFAGASGILLSLFAVPAGGTAFDFHCVFLMLAGFCGGSLSLAVCAAVQALYRLFGGGFGAAAVAGASSILLASAAAVLIGRAKLSRLQKWAVCTVLCVPATLVDFLPAGNPWHPGLIFTACFVPVSALSYSIISALMKTDTLVRRLHRESTQDYLTGLNNVRRFDEMFNLAVRTSKKLHQNLSLLMCDIDYFKKINDRYGHQNGDAILIQLSRILQRNFPLGVLSRNGGEEFTVLLRGFTETQALSAAERLRADVEQSPFSLVEGGQIHITISIGAASCSEDGAEHLLEKADMALYTAKRSGRNKVSAACSGRRNPTADPAHNVEISP